MSLVKFLNSIGLDEKNQKVYLALLKLTDAPGSLVAKKASLPRTTTYHQLEKLINLGLVSTYRNKGVKRFVAENPGKIKGILEGKLAQFDKYLPELQDVPFEKKQKTNLRLFEGVEGRRQLIEEELNCREKLVRSIGSVRDLRKVQGGSIGFSKRRMAKKVFSKCLRPQDDEFAKGWLQSQTKELREVRLLPDKVNLSGMIFIYDNKLAVISPEQEEGIGFLVESESLSRSMKSMFDALWGISQRTI